MGYRIYSIGMSVLAALFISVPLHAEHFPPHHSPFPNYGIPNHGPTVPYRHQRPLPSQYSPATFGNVPQQRFPFPNRSQHAPTYGHQHQRPVQQPHHGHAHAQHLPAHQPKLIPGQPHPHPHALRGPRVHQRPANLTDYLNALTHALKFNMDQMNLAVQSIAFNPRIGPPLPGSVAIPANAPFGNVRLPGAWGWGATFVNFTKDIITIPFDIARDSLKVYQAYGVNPILGYASIPKKDVDHSLALFLHVDFHYQNLPAAIHFVHQRAAELYQPWFAVPLLDRIHFHYQNIRILMHRIRHIPMYAHFKLGPCFECNYGYATYDRLNIASWNGLVSPIHTGVRALTPGVDPVGGPANVGTYLPNERYAIEGEGRAHRDGGMFWDGYDQTENVYHRDTFYDREEQIRRANGNEELLRSDDLQRAQEFQQGQGQQRYRQGQTQQQQYQQPRGQQQYQQGQNQQYRRGQTQPYQQGQTQQRRADTSRFFNNGQQQQYRDQQYRDQQYRNQSRSQNRQYQDQQQRSNGNDIRRADEQRILQPGAPNPNRGRN